MTDTYTIHAFYHFIGVDDVPAQQAVLSAFCKEGDYHGTILVAPEGINGTVSNLSADKMMALMRFLEAQFGIPELEYKVSYSDELPFRRMKVKIKREIVTLGVPQVNPHEKVGMYVDSKEWNALISDPDVVVLDTRNDYEVHIGTFKNALDPKTKTFGKFPAYVQQALKDQKAKKIAMFCTGGIRCEKASSYMLMEGYDEVYHLKGGILKYLEEMPKEESLWEGDCFVFDNRVAVGHGLMPSNVELCFGCRNPILPEDKLSPLYEPGISCPDCGELLTPAQRASRAERQRQMMRRCV